MTAYLQGNKNWARPIDWIGDQIYVWSHCP